MKIGIDARFLTHPQRGGFKSYTSAIISALAEVGAGNEYVLYTDRPADRHLPENFSIRPVKGVNAVIREQIVLPLMMRRDGIDLAHFPCNTGPILSNLPMIATIHDTIPFRKREYGSRKQQLLNSYWRAVMPRCAGKARIVLTVSDYVVNDLVRTLGVAREKIRVVYNSVDPIFLGHDPGIKPSGMEQGAPFILAFASADGRKNHKGVLEAYRTLKPELDDLNLALVCSNSRVVVDCEGAISLRRVSNRELVWLYRNALAFVFPSFDEGFGLPPLEAMSCGTPVVASEAGALAEVVNGCAMIVDPHDAAGIANGLRSVLTDHSLRERLIASGRDRASQFTRRLMGEKLLSAYSEAVSSRLTHHGSRISAMKILFLTQICPYPPTNGGAIKTYNILKRLGARHDVTLLTFIREQTELSAISHLSQFCREIDHCIIKRSPARNLFDAATALAARKSFIITRDRHPEMLSKVMRRMKERPDLIYVDHLQMSQFVPNPAPCPVLLDEHNVEWRIIERFASEGASLPQRVFGSLEWRKLRAYELSACRKADFVLTVTPNDRDTLVENGVSLDKLDCLPIGVNVDQVQPVTRPSESKNILSFGTMSWPPNVDAIEHFANDIYPLIRREVPEARFTVVGSNPPPEIKALGKDPSIEVTGFVDDIRPYAEAAAVFVVPLRIGSGMRVKILDAMALGLSIVTTSVGCEGISLEPGKHALVADSPGQFAESVVSLLRNPKIRVEIGSAGRTFVESNYAWKPILQRLDAILSRFE